MKPETQKIILDTATQVFTDLGRALGIELVGYDQSVSCLKEYGSKTVFETLEDILKKAAPVIGGEHTISLDNLLGYVAAMDTREKAEIILSQLPEPNPRSLKWILKEASELPSEIRTKLHEFSQLLPQPPGGRKRIFETPESEREAREEVTKLMIADGLSFPAAKRKVARRRRISASTMNRLFREESNLEE